MNKRILNAILCGALISASASTFVSCKDYDEDINNLQEQIKANKAALDAAQKAIGAEIAGLKTQLEAKGAEIAALQQQAATLDAAVKKAQNSADQAEANAQAALKNIADEIVRAQAAEAALESKILKLQEADVELKNLIDANKNLINTKVDQADYDKEVAAIYAKIKTCSEECAAALKDASKKLQDSIDTEAQKRQEVDEDLQKQITAVDNFAKKLEETEKADIKAVNEAIAAVKKDLADVKAALEKQIADNKAALEKAIKDLAEGQVATNAKNIEQLQKDQQALSNKIDAVQAELNTLTIFVKQALRGLVFVPDCYYWGVEATTVKTMNYEYYTALRTLSVDAETEQTAEDKAHTLCATGNAFKILNFAAKYHLNPSSADLKDATINILSDDKEFVTNRAAASGISYGSHSVENGDLVVNLKINNPALVKEVLTNHAVTVFATEIKINKAGKDTTITSDYAALLKDEITNGYQLSHVKGAYKNEHCGDCAATGYDHTHLYKSAYEAGHTYGSDHGVAAADKVAYNSTLDLRTLVETHYTSSVDGHKAMSAADFAKNNLEYKFELTGLIYGVNETSESAHAAIATDGYTFRPQVVGADGKQLAYGAEQNPSIIGRTPLVRVSLIDKSDNKVLDYGYIRIAITDVTPDPDKKPAPVSVTYDANPADAAARSFTATDYACQSDVVSGKDYAYATKWNEIEYKIYNDLLKISKADFESKYTAVTVDPSNPTETNLQQYSVKADGTYEAVAAVGSISETKDANETNTNIIKWTIPFMDLYNAIEKKTADNFTRAICFHCDDIHVADVYVIINLGKLTVTDVTWTKVSATYDLSKVKNADYWYAENSSEKGTAEMHINVKPVEDAVAADPTAQAEDLEATISNTFVGNKIISNAAITVSNDPTKEFQPAENDLKYSLVFAAANTGKVFKGQSGKDYTLGVSADGLTLTAKNGATTQNVAKLVCAGTYDINKVVLDYQHSDFAEDLLNANAHDNLTDDYLKAIVAIKVVNSCDINLPISGNEFTVRFLRPINFTGNDAALEDASVNNVQTINLRDLVKLTDWRDAWRNNASDYWTYYDIKSITVNGAPTAANTVLNQYITTNMNGANFGKKLSEVSNNIEFKYSPVIKTVGAYGTADSYGTLTYTNNQTTVHEFQVKVPVKVTYEWGSIVKDVTLTVKKTAGNANIR